MAFTAQRVIDIARRRVLDVEVPYRFDDGYYIDGINECITVMMGLNAALFTHRKIVKLAVGVHQTLPESTEVLVKLTRNWGDDGLTAGPAITPVTGATMDASQRDWMQATASNTVKYYFLSDHSKREFFVSPPQPVEDLSKGITQGYVEGEFVMHPGLVYATSDVVAGVRDMYMSAMGNFVASYVLQTDDEDPTTAAKVEKFFHAFAVVVGDPEVLESNG